MGRNEETTDRWERLLSRLDNYGRVTVYEFAAVIPFPLWGLDGNGGAANWVAVHFADMPYVRHSVTRTGEVNLVTLWVDPAPDDGAEETHTWAPLDPDLHDDIDPVLPDEEDPDLEIDFDFDPFPLTPEDDESIEEYLDGLYDYVESRLGKFGPIEN